MEGWFGGVVVLGGGDVFGRTSNHVLYTHKHTHTTHRHIHTHKSARAHTHTPRMVAFSGLTLATQQLQDPKTSTRNPQPETREQVT
jgi:hypothetical protein